MEVLKLCDCENLTSSYAAHCKRNKLQSQIAQCEWALRAQYTCGGGSEERLATLGYKITTFKNFIKYHTQFG